LAESVAGAAKESICWLENYGAIDRWPRIPVGDWQNDIDGSTAKSRKSGERRLGRTFSSALKNPEALDRRGFARIWK